MAETSAPHCQDMVGGHIVTELTSHLADRASGQGGGGKRPRPRGAEITKPAGKHVAEELCWRARAGG